TVETIEAVEATVEATVEAAIEAAIEAAVETTVEAVGLAVGLAVLLTEAALRARAATAAAVTAGTVLLTVVAISGTKVLTIDIVDALALTTFLTLREIERVEINGSLSRIHTGTGGTSNKLLPALTAETTELRHTRKTPLLSTEITLETHPLLCKTDFFDDSYGDYVKFVFLI